MAGATTPDVAANPKKQKRADMPASGNVKKPRASPPAKQTNTLDMWFKKAAPKATTSAAAASAASAAAAATTAKSDDSQALANDFAAGHAKSSDSPPTELAAEPTSVASPPVQKMKVLDAASSSSKKFVQRRIHINDPCRVCESARTDEVSRCELRCLGCDMTVHKKCYDVQSEDPIDDWQCRRCLYILDKKEELLTDVDAGASASAPGASESDSALLPTHESLDESHKYRELHSESDFATIFQFLKRFRRMGLKLSLDLTLKNLANALTATSPSKFMEELHLRLLTNVEATISKNQDWTVSLARFLASAEHRPSSSTLDAFIASASAKKEQATGADSAAERYTALSTSERVAVLKFVCEAQFDDNEALVERIGDQEGDSLRDEPVGVDSSGRTYWTLEDPPSVLDGTAWVCRCETATSDDGAPSQWETVSDGLETLESLVECLSLSAATADLQLWQKLSGGILKSLVRRTKKQQQSAARLARMPRMLGGASGLDLAAIVDGNDSFGVRRSTRSRRAVSYRVAESEESEEDEEEEEELEEEANGSDAEEEDEEDGDESDANDEDEDERPSKRPRRSVQRQTRKPKRVETEPSRRSSRLRGGDGSGEDASTAASPRRRSDRRVAADASMRSSNRSSRAAATASPASDDGDGDESSSSDNNNSSAEEEEE